MHRRTFFKQSVVLGACLALSPIAPLAQVSSIGDSINKAGRQRMLSQRIAKAYFQIGQEFDTVNSKRILDWSVTRFDRQLVELKNYGITPEIKALYLNMERAWLTYKDLVIGNQPDAQRAKQVLATSEEMLTIAERGTKLFEAQMMASGTSELGQLINISGRQRMLSQRMAKYYQASAWNLGGSELITALDTAKQEFLAGMQRLRIATATTAAIREQLSLVYQQWIFFDAALKQPRTGPQRVQFGTNVATTSERILELMDAATGMYEKLGS